MNRILLLIPVLFLAISLKAQETIGGFNFSTVKEIPTTPVRDQARSGTCWSFAAVGLIEAELIRMGKGEYDLSEMFFVNYAYRHKGIRYMRYHGAMNYGSGGQAHNVMNLAARYGFITEEAYTGLKADEEKHHHAEMDAVLKAFLDALKRNPGKTLSNVWITAYNAIIDTYLGHVPESFTINKKNYTPLSFMKETGFKPEDYIELTSYMHHPFNTAINLEIPDNWSGQLYYNISIEDLIRVMKHAISKGYTVAWDGDVSDKGFSHKNGLAVLPAQKAEDVSGSERARWESIAAEEREKQMYSFKQPVVERNVTQESRQLAFDNFTATDDHLMLLTALVKDQNGTSYFKTKNSWGTENNPYEGYLYISEPYARQNTIAIMIHKDALPDDIKLALKIK